MNLRWWHIVARYELWLLAAAAPFLLFPGTWAPIALGIILLTWVARRLATGAFIVRTPADFPLLYLLLMAGVSLYASVDVQTSFPAFWRLLLGIAIYYGLANTARDRRTLRVLTLLMAVGGLGMVLLTLVATRWDAVRLLHLPQVYDRLPALLTDPEDGQLIHPRVMGMALATVLPVLVSVAFFSRDPWRRAACGLAALVIAAVLPLTQSLGGLVGAACALAVLAVWRSRWFLLALLPAAGLAGWAVDRLDLQALAARLLSTQDTLGIGVALRFDMWSRTLAMIRDMPFTGIGLGTFSLVQSNFYPGIFIGPEPHAHNVFLQVSLDLGLPGLLALIGLLIAALVMVVRTGRARVDREEMALVIGLAAGMLSYLLANQTDTLWHPKFGVLLWVLLGLLAAAYGQAHSGPAISEQRRSSRAVASLPWALPLVVLVLSLLLPGVRELNAGTLQAHKLLYAARKGAAVPTRELVAAQAHLLRGVSIDTDRAHAHSLLGSLYAVQGDDPAAFAAFQRQVALDMADPLAAYAPFEALRRSLAAENPGDPTSDLLWIYSQWMWRFPTRAEPNVWAAIVHEQYRADLGEARAVLQQGLERGAQPRGILEYGFDRVGS